MGERGGAGAAVLAGCEQVHACLRPLWQAAQAYAVSVGSRSASGGGWQLGQLLQVEVIQSIGDGFGLSFDLLCQLHDHGQLALGQRTEACSSHTTINARPQDANGCGLK